MGAFAQPSSLVPPGGGPPRPQFLPARLDERVPLTGSVTLRVPPLQYNHDGTPTLACDCYHLGNRDYFLPVKVGHSHTPLNPHRPFLKCPYPDKDLVPRCHFYVWIDQLPAEHHAVALQLLETERFCSTLAPEVLLAAARAEGENNKLLFGSPTMPYSDDYTAVRQGISRLLNGRDLASVTVDELGRLQAVSLAVAYELRRAYCLRAEHLAVRCEAGAAAAHEEDAAAASGSEA
ncbi:hypothetical protein JCM9279_006197 [Rhodotorula babjevae]